MTRWVCMTNYVTADRDNLQRVTVYPAEANKERVKAENELYNYTRLLLLAKKSRKESEYIIHRESQAGKGNVSSKNGR